MPPPSAPSDLVLFLRSRLVPLCPDIPSALCLHLSRGLMRQSRNSPPCPLMGAAEGRALSSHVSDTSSSGQQNRAQRRQPCGLSGRKEGMNVSTPTPGASRSPGHRPPLPPPRWGCAPTPARPHLLPTSRGVPLDRSLAEGAHLPKLRGQQPREHGGRTYRPGERGTCTAPYPRTTSFPNTSGPYTLSTICGPSNDKAGVSPWGILGRAGQRAGPWSLKPPGVGLTENGVNVGTSHPTPGASATQDSGGGKRGAEPGGCPVLADAPPGMLSDSNVHRPRKSAGIQV